MCTSKFSSCIIFNFQFQMVSSDLRKRVVEFYIHGHKQRKISKKFGIPIYTDITDTTDIINVYTKESMIKSKLKGKPRNKALSGEHIESLKSWINEDTVSETKQ